VRNMEIWNCNTFHGTLVASVVIPDAAAKA
jgi:hypothetical protein